MQHTQTEPKIISLDGEPDSYFELSQYLFNKAMADPARRSLIETMCADPRLETKDVFATAFSFGVTEMVCAMQAGMIHKVDSN